jgi:hypothetical protein
MNRKSEVEAQLSYPPETSSKPIPFPGIAAQRMIPRRASGWDPYEVWRTRVKEEASRDPVDERLGLDKVG